jgi:hypothetical protein
MTPSDSETRISLATLISPATSASFPASLEEAEETLRNHLR